MKTILLVLHENQHDPFLFVTYCLSSMSLLPWFNFCDFFPEMSRFPNRHHAIIRQSECAISQKSGIHSTVLCGLITNQSAPAMAPYHKKISGCKGKGSILTHHVRPVCSKDFVSSLSLAFHITSVPYCCQSWLSVSNGFPIDNIVLPTNTPSFCQDPGNHSLLISEHENYNGEVMLLHEFRWISRHKKDHPLHLTPSEAINNLAKLVYQAITTKGVSLSGVTLHCFTEDKHKGFIFCVHPNYWCKGPSMTGYTTSTGRWVFEGQWRFQLRSGVLWT